MPLTCRIDKSLKTVFSKAEGVMTSQELTDFHWALLRDPDFDPSFNLLFDGSEVTKFDVGFDDWRAIASAKRFGPGSRRAFVAPNRMAVLRRFRMSQSLRDAEPGDSELFDDIAEARKWLGLVSTERPDRRSIGERRTGMRRRARNRRRYHAPVENEQRSMDRRK